MTVYCDKAHRYWVVDDYLAEHEVPGVTSILEKAGLVDLTWVTQFGLDRGQAVHDSILFYNQGDLDESSLDPAVKPYLEQYIRFERMLRVKEVNGEQIVYSKIYNFAGRYDMLIEYFGSLWLIDLKTNKAPKHVVPQLGLYAFALREAGVKLSRVACLELFTDDFKLTSWEPLQAEAEGMRVLTQLR